MVIKGLQCGGVLYLECLVTLHHSVQLDRHWHHSCDKLVSFPDPLAHVRERGSGVLSDFSCHSSPIWELESDCRTCNYMRWCGNRARDLVCMQCMGSTIITFFTPFDPAPSQVTRHLVQLSGTIIHVFQLLLVAAGPVATTNPTLNISQNRCLFSWGANKHNIIFW